jgi:hypothetical protein
MKVCLLDMDDRTRQSMALVLGHRGGDVALVDFDAADIAVVDLDHEGAPQTFLAIHARQPALQAIGLTAREDVVAQADITVLRKPVSANRLLEAIQKQAGVETPASRLMAAAVAAAALGGRTAAARRRPEQKPAAALPQDKKVFDPAQHLLGVLLDALAEAARQNAVAVVTFYGDRVILADNRGVIRTNLSSSQARGFALSAFDNGARATTATISLDRPQVRFVSSGDAARYADSTYVVRQETFMWTLGALTSRGRLPADTRPDERVYLRRWPNLTRIAHSANEMRIIAYWVCQATSLAEIVDALGVSEREVFNVYTAAYAAGIAGKARREVDGIWEAPPVVAPRERGLLASILGRLLQRKPTEQEAPEGVLA